MKIGLVGLVYDNNYGDNIIYQSVYNYLKKNNNVKILPIDLYCRKKFNDRIKVNLIKRIILCVLWCFKHIFRNEKFLFKCDIIKMKLLYKKGYKKSLKTCDKVIFYGGGMIKFKQQKELVPCENIVVDVCNRYGIKIMFNSVGIEGYDSSSYYCIRLKKLLNNDCVNVITTRDNLSVLNNCYISKKSIITSLVGDSALMISESYNIQNSTRGYVGINVIREDIFEDYNNNINSQQYRLFLEETINKLLELGEKPLLYTNGLKADSNLLFELVNKYNIEYRIPQNPNELLEIISSLKYNYASRLHSSIISFSFNIPTCSIVWNDKILMFYSLTKNEDNIVDISKKYDFFVPKTNFEQNNELINLTKKYLDIFLKI